MPKGEIRYGIAALAMGTQAGVVGLLTPIYFGMLVRQMGLTPDRLGMIASIEKIGGIVVMLAMAAMIARINLRLASLSGLVLLILATIACAITRDFGLLLFLRVLIGIATSITGATQTAYLAATEQPERWFGWRVTVSILLTIVGLAAMPYVEARWGMTGFYLALLAPTPIWIWSIYTLPLKVPVRTPPVSLLQSDGLPQKEPAPVRTDVVYMTLALLAIAFWGAFVTPVYDFSERYGDAIGMTPQAIGWVLSVTTAAGLIGSLAVSWLGSRFGRVTPLSVGTAGAVLTCAILAGDYGETGYLVALGIFSIVWSFNLPYLMGLIAVADPEGRWTIVGSACVEILKVPVLLAFGYVIATIGLHGGAIMAGILVTVSLCFAIAARLYERRKVARATA